MTKRPPPMLPSLPRYRGDTLAREVLAKGSRVSDTRPLPVGQLVLAGEYAPPGFSGAWDVSGIEILRAAYRRGRNPPAPFVHAVDGRLYVVDGWHRYRAAFLEGLTALECHVEWQSTQEAAARVSAALRNHPRG